jgi:formylglycine-generating enzyme required for sulfatase activity
MSGNVFEWCNDWYGETAYNADAVVDPTGPESGTIHVLRSGYWNFFARYCRSAFRNTGDPKGRVGSAGFRLVREVD